MVLKSFMLLKRCGCYVTSATKLVFVISTSVLKKFREKFKSLMY